MKKNLMDKISDKAIIIPLCASCFIFVSLIQDATHLNQSMMVLICFGICILFCITFLPYELWRKRKTKSKGEIK